MKFTESLACVNPSSALILLIGWQEEQPACRDSCFCIPQTFSCWAVGQHWSNVDILVVVVAVVVVVVVVVVLVLVVVVVVVYCLFADVQVLSGVLVFQWPGFTLSVIVISTHLLVYINICVAVMSVKDMPSLLCQTVSLRISQTFVVWQWLWQIQLYLLR